MRGQFLDAPSSLGVTGSTSKPLDLDNPVSPQPKQKNALREALVDLDDDGLDDEGGTAFESGDGAETQAEDAAILGEPGLPIQPSAVEASIGDDTAQSDDVLQQYHNFSSETRKCYSSLGHELTLPWYMIIRTNWVNLTTLTWNTF